jgi:hypothetical protein
MISRVKVLLTR